jgi:acyl-CoA thioester hydrolase
MRVPFYDVDPAGVVWHGRYFQYFELARRELLESVGYSYDEMIESGLIWAVTDATVRYLRPLMLNQEVLVTACLREWEFRIVVDYRIEDDDGRVFTRGRTIQAPVDPKTYELTLGAPEFFVENVRAKQREQGLIDG